MVQSGKNQQTENLDAKIDFGSGVDHMNQIISFDRLTYFGYIFEETGMLEKMKGSPTAKVAKPQVAFGIRVEKTTPVKIRAQATIEAYNLEQEATQAAEEQETGKFFTP